MAETTTVIPWRCMRCGQRIEGGIATYIGSEGPMHDRCAATPPMTFAPPPVSADEIRQIVREELERARGVAGTFNEQQEKRHG